MTYSHIPASTFCLEPIILFNKRHCEHHRDKYDCKECKGSSICDVKNVKVVVYVNIII